MGGLRELDLSGDGFAALPAGLFAGLSLREASLADNPGAAFTLAVELARTDADRWADGPATVEARLPAGAPLPMRLSLTAEPMADGLPTLLDIPAGATAVEPFTASAPPAGALCSALAPPYCRRRPAARSGNAPERRLAQRYPKRRPAVAWWYQARRA